MQTRPQLLIYCGGNWHTHNCSRHLVQMDFINKASSGEGTVAS